jgi:hypothetical protein
MAEWTVMPLSKTLEEERKQVNLLSIQLTDVNISLEERKKILEKLKAINPDIVEGLEAENLNYIKLTENVAAYNDQMLNRIVYEQQNENVAKAVKKRDKEAQNAAEARLKVIKLLSDQVDIWQKKDAAWGKQALDISRDTNLTYDERLIKLGQLGKEFNKVLQESGGGLVKENFQYELEAYNRAIWKLENDEKRLQETIKEREKLKESLKIETSVPVVTTPQYKEGEEMMVDGVLMVYKGGKWVEKKVGTPGGGDPLKKVEAQMRILYSAYNKSGK